MKTNRNIWFDLVRGLSALAVCASHLRPLILRDFGELVSPGLVAKIFYFATGLGHQAVMVFFVLSGYFVGGSVLRTGADFSWRKYLDARLTRLWVVLLPALILTWLCDRIVTNFNPAVLGGKFAAVWNSGPSPSFPARDDVLTAIGNIFFQQGITCEVFGSNGPLWSLACEFWYYLAFPAVVLGILLKGGRKILSWVIFILIMSLMPNGMRILGLVWFMGVVVWSVPTKRFKGEGFAVFLTLLLLFASLAISKSKLLEPHISDLAIGSIFSLLAYLIKDKKCEHALLSRMAIGISEISYSLYLSHFPILILAGALFVGDQLLSFNLISLSIFLCCLFCLVATGASFWWAFERNTKDIRGFFQRKIHI